jgi:TfoX/Sxy family transcriptional regulator of competence genes
MNSNPFQSPLSHAMGSCSVLGGSFLPEHLALAYFEPFFADCRLLKPEMMPYSEKLTDRIREALVDEPNLEEKKMFRGICFLVNGKMCICVSENEIMCRIGPEKFALALEKQGCRSMTRNGKEIIGYVYVAEEQVRTKKDLHHWIRLCLDFNEMAKATKPKKKKSGKSGAP